MKSAVAKAKADFAALKMKDEEGGESLEGRQPEAACPLCFLTTAHKWQGRAAIWHIKLIRIR